MSEEHKKIGIAVLNMKMPKDCPLCAMAHYNALNHFTGCEVVPGKRYAMSTEKGYAETSDRPGWCPLAEVENIEETCEFVDSGFLDTLFCSYCGEAVGTKADTQCVRFCPYCGRRRIKHEI